MAYEMKAGQGSVFRNEKKVEDWHADWRGRVMLPDGAVHWLEVTSKKTKAGGDWLSVKIGKQIEGPSAHERAKVNGYQSQGEDIPL
jgi:hypothetical protein